MDHSRAFSAFPLLETERLRLREFRESDAEGVFQVYGNPEVGRFNRWEVLQNQAEAVEKIRLFRRQYAEGLRLRWAIAVKDSDEVIGDIAFVMFDPRLAQGEMGFNLGAAHWGKGLMREAAEAVLGFGFGKMEMLRVSAIVLAENLPCLGLLKRLGFVREGVLRKAGMLKGEVRDLELLALLREDWENYAQRTQA